MNDTRAEIWHRLGDALFGVDDRVGAHMPFEGDPP